MKFISKIFAYPFILLIKIYQAGISPIIGPSCRYTPTMLTVRKRSFAETWNFKRRMDDN
ncbi:MAG: membrane protein insertion efficiency factor YidD [Segetibacter sp.]